MQADLFRRSVDLKGFLRVSGYRTLIFRSISPCSSLTELSTLAWSISPWLLSPSTFQHWGASICQKAHKDVSPSIHLFLAFVSSSIPRYDFQYHDHDHTVVITSAANERIRPHRSAIVPSAYVDACGCPSLTPYLLDCDPTDVFFFLMISRITTWEGRQPKCTCYVLIKRTQRTTGFSPPLCFYAHIKCTVERGPSNYAPRLPVLIWYRYLAEGARSDRVKEEDPESCHT
ncbi:hypothetical protein EDD85DRAFT_321774 [Armillaria nabsnona]|nr:hypothetical protein EDD85DRAFT_321774 [Armillaria nabsnona]